MTHKANPIYLLNIELRNAMDHARMGIDSDNKNKVGLGAILFLLEVAIGIFDAMYPDF